MEKYDVLEMIGEGSFGRVYKGRRKYSAQVVNKDDISWVGFHTLISSGECGQHIDVFP